MSRVEIRPPAKGSLVADGRNYHSYDERKEAIENANKHQQGYYVVRSLQQAWPSHLPAIKHHFHQYNDCVSCPLGQCPFVVGKVYYRGYIPADVLFIGEAPGSNEDTVARPFIGQSGKVLDDIIIDISRRLTDNKNDNAFRWCITNSVLCLPYNQGETRLPTVEEIKACNHRLRQFIEIAAPSVIVTVGRIAERAWNIMTKNGTEIPHLGWHPQHESERFQPIHINIEDPKWMIKNIKDLHLNMKKAILKVHAVMKPLFEMET